MRLRSLLPAVATLSALALVLAGCGDPAGDTSPDSPEDPGGAQEPEGEADDGSEPDDASDDASDETDDGDDADDDEVSVTAFFTRSTDAEVYVEPEVHPVASATVEEHAAPMTVLFGGEPTDPALDTQVPDGVQLLDATVDGEVLVVDVDEAMADTSGSSAQEVAFAEQLAHTAASVEGVEQVRLTIAGEEIDELWGHLDWSAPIAPDPLALSPITIEQPSYGIEVPAGTLTVAGEATVFEATLMLRVLQDGEVIEEIPVTASEGGPGRGTWSHELTIDEPGSYTLEAEESDPSGGEGPEPFVTTRDVEVAAG